MRRAAAPFSSLWFPILLVPAAVVVGLLVEGSLAPGPCDPNASCYQEVQVSIAGNVLVGWSTIAAGLVTWFRRSSAPGGRLLTAAGFAWFLGAASWASGDGGAFQGYYLLLVSALILTYPSGRIGDRLALLLLLALTATLAASTLGRLAFMQNVDLFGNCDPTDPTCTKIPNDVFGDPVPGFELYNTLDSAYRVVLGLEIVGVLAVILHRFVVSTRAHRRVLLPPVAMAAALAAAVGLAVARRTTGFDPSLADTFLVGVVIALTALPHAFTWDLVRGRLARGAVADLVVQLARPATPNVLGASLGRALGDPSVSVLVWSPEAGAYLDESGNPIELPTRGGSRATTLLAREGVPVGALVHDPAVRVNAELLSSVSAAAALTIDNMRLAAEVQAQLDEVRAS
ncbi:MAG: hypothetical protein ACHQNA_13230, partial [Acidimicrobiales bacterium]